MNDRSAVVKNTWVRIFSVLWHAVLSDARLHDQPPPVKIAFSDRLSSKRGARIRPFVLEVSTQFALDLHNELGSVQDALAGLAFSTPSLRRAHRGKVLAAIEELTIGFVLLHELFHLIGGHLDWYDARRANGLKVDGQQLCLQLTSSKRHGGQGAPTYRSTADAYLLECEADCSAIQWIVQAMPQSKLRRLLRTQAASMTSFPQPQRLAAFRLLLASVWLVIRRLESGKEKLVRNSSETHPLPVTRVFAGFGTLIREYSCISDLRYDAQGGGQRTLTNSDVISMREFLERVLKPVLTSDWNPGSPHLPAESLEAQMRFYLHDFGNHMLNRPVQTIAGHELLRMERARFRMDRGLRPFRYYQAVELKRMKAARKQV
jgi:hypothetical protein